MNGKDNLSWWQESFVFENGEVSLTAAASVEGPLVTDKGTDLIIPITVGRACDPPGRTWAALRA
ncbi:hypothetical protein E5675_05540 [Sphingopyxis sp. PAMC25046]|nr:hypothetical protein E5675_05540 [Sphingopyxis sp. PAMC25046]